jgi:hypothetical protein
VPSTFPAPSLQLTLGNATRARQQGRGIEHLQVAGFRLVDDKPLLKTDDFPEFAKAAQE